MSRKSGKIRTVLICGCIHWIAMSSLAMAQPALGGGESKLDCPCSETITSYPYSEDFEEGFGSWIHIDDDDFDWEHAQGSTPSDNTGPDFDHTLGTDQGHFVFTEASDNTENTGILLGPCFDLSSLASPEFALWYHMAGDNMGSLYIEISSDDCQTWNTEVEIHEHQGWDWNLVTIDLTQYANQTICVRLRAVTGTTYQSDICVDDIYVGEPVTYEGGCCDVATGDCLGLMTEAECLAMGEVTWHRVRNCTEDNFCTQPPPENDQCFDAVEIDTIPFVDEDVDIKWATPDLPVSCDSDGCDESSGHGIWYMYTPAEYCGARIRFDTNYGGMNGFISVFTGPDCDNLVEVFCSADQVDSTWQEITVDLEAGITYWILIGSFWCEGEPAAPIDVTFDCSLGACCIENTCQLMTANECKQQGSYYFGDHSVCQPGVCDTGACCTDNGCEMWTWDECSDMDYDFHGYGVQCELNTCPPINETCLEAITVYDGMPAAEGSTELASEDDDEEASCHDGSNRDLWYAYTAVETGTVYVDTEGSEVWDTVLSVWNQCHDQEIACASDGPNGDQAALEFEAIAGRTYYIRFAPNMGIRRTFVINISHEEGQQGGCCLGDSCIVDYRLTCEEAGGVYGGDGTSCPGDDCNSNGIEDLCDFLAGPSEDCNENLIPDECDIDDETSADLDGNGVPDECDPDCNDNGIIDGCDVTCDGDCSQILECGESDDCQGDIIPDECQLEDEGCEGERYSNGNADLQMATRPDYGWANYGIADDFTLDEDSEGTCIRVELFDVVDTEAFPVMQIRIYENYDGLMDLPPFWEATPVFDATYRVDDGTLMIEDSGEGMSGLNLIYLTGTGIDWSLNEGDYAFHLTFPETEHAGFWARSGEDDSDCAIYWGDWWGWPTEICDDEFNFSKMAFSLLGPADNDCNGNDIPDECDIEEGTSQDVNGNEVPDECEDFIPGDFDYDDDVDLDDFSILSGCLGGPAAGIFGGCENIDINDDGQIDLLDYAEFSVFFSNE